MTYLIIALVLAAAVTLIMIWRAKAQPPAETRYVCDRCGERDCDCHRVED